MAGYDYGYRSGYSNGKGSVGAHPNERSKTSYADDECRTVIVDADGTRRTIIGCTPLHKPGSYVTTTETITQERVFSPFPAAYKHNSPPSSPVKGYGYAADDHKQRRPSSPVKGYGYAADDHKQRRPSSPVKGYGYAADDHKPRRPSSPVKGYGYAADDHKLRRPSSPVKGYGYATDDHKLGRPSSPVKGYGYAADDHKLSKPSSPVKGYGYAADDHMLCRPSSPVQGYAYAADDHKLGRPSSPVKSYGYVTQHPSSGYDCPREVGDFFTKVQTEASHDHPSNGVNWHQPPQQTRPSGSTGYGDYGDYKNKTFHGPNGNTIQNENYHQARPIPSMWIPPPGREGQLTSATDDMETALRFLKESVKSSSATTATPQYSPYSAAPKQGEYRTNAAKKNVRFSLNNV